MNAKAALQLLAAPTVSEWEAALPHVYRQLRDGQPMNREAWYVLVQAVRQDRLFFTAASTALTIWPSSAHTSKPISSCNTRPIFGEE